MVLRQPNRVSNGGYHDLPMNQGDNSSSDGSGGMYRDRSRPVSTVSKVITGVLLQSLVSEWYTFLLHIQPQYRHRSVCSCLIESESFIVFDYNSAPIFFL